VRLPRNVGGEDLAKRLRKYGYQVVRQTGSHMQLVSIAKSKPHRITISRHKPLRVGTLDGILERLQNTCKWTSRIRSVTSGGRAGRHKVIRRLAFGSHREANESGDGRLRSGNERVRGCRHVGVQVFAKMAKSLTEVSIHGTRIVGHFRAHR